MGDNNTLLLGAVAYDPKVIAIWDGFGRYFARHGLPFDYVLYTNYERQVEAHIAGHVHVAWNSPLAWLQSERIAEILGRRAEAICMRDSDCDLTSVVLVRSNSGIHDFNGLRDSRVAVGAYDSPQATLIPLSLFAANGLEPRQDFEVVPFDVLVGKHGDHIGGERDAVRALVRGDVDAACILDGNHLAFAQEGTLPHGSTRILGHTPAYDHCNFTVFDNAPPQMVNRFRELLLAMQYSDAEVRPLLDMEGLKQWVPGRTNGYAALAIAVDRFKTIDSFVAGVVERCK
ncbi:MAG: PhnD/SsuA/transferrin family substrate-binding protein [Bryobacteraceae bacterium]